MEPVSVLFADPVARAFAAGILIAPLIASLGVFATLRRMALFGEGIGHASLAGVAVAVIAGLAPLPVALAWGVLVAFVLYHLERSTKLPPDSVLGMLFTTSMALGIVLFSVFTGDEGLEVLEETLFGSVFSVSGLDLALAVVAAIVIFGWLLFAGRSLTFLSLSKDSAFVNGVNVGLHTLLLYLSLAAAIVFGVKLVGLILVSALLVTPAAAARQVAGTFKGTMVATVVIAELAVLIGLWSSIRFGLPSGAPIVLAATALFAATSLVSGIRKA
ncbi:hypothetical protein A2856_02160 [Candidatus Uhrbacteria bacterium RIFCSPHIGHO2_01_FULL_63_20]|uniref:ABC transporter n=1 Tax=Candidatus Uhrbacteria bacterium RIFCSPHIGHO2_01_FULL_63_20 TaxID=1802385 RepID=A0A1F7TKD0_9BACT|nr:MAG: hypothetical protein A2856_02160 [Candidatus Uhrbacteria bacterium RIFCSPHIGHO2_01_FULL_63_20]